MKSNTCRNEVCKKRSRSDNKIEKENKLRRLACHGRVEVLD
jgi:hypothetical protein